MVGEIGGGRGSRREVGGGRRDEEGKGWGNIGYSVERGAWGGGIGYLIFGGTGEGIGREVAGEGGGRV